FNVVGAIASQRHWFAVRQMSHPDIEIAFARPIGCIREKFAVGEIAGSVSSPESKVNWVGVGGAGGCEGLSFHQMPPPTTSSAPTAAVSIRAIPWPGLTGRAATLTLADSDSSFTSSKATFRSAIFWKRRAGSFF